MAVSLTATSTDNVDYGDIAAIGGLSGVTVASTFRPTAATATGHRIVEKWEGPAAASAFIVNVQDTNELGFIVNGTGNGLFGRKTTGLNFASGTTYRIVVTWAAGSPNVMVLRVDGVVEAIADLQTTDQDSVRDATSPFRIGDASGETNIGAGDHSEVAVWDHVIPDWVATAYGNGFSPSFYRTGGILYDRVLGTNSFNEWANDEPTHTGTVNASHPRVIMPSMPLLVTAASAAGTILPQVNAEMFAA